MKEQTNGSKHLEEKVILIPGIGDFKQNLQYVILTSPVH